MFLLDTNVVSELRKFHNHSINPNVERWFAGINPTQTFISATTIMEIRVGILLKQRRAPRQATIFQDWFERFILPNYQYRTLPITSEIAEICAELHVPNKRPFSDAYIAATAKAHNFTLVTRNTKDFKDIKKLKLLNPFEPILQ